MPSQGPISRFLGVRVPESQGLVFQSPGSQGLRVPGLRVLGLRVLESQVSGLRVPGSGSQVLILDWLYKKQPD